MMLDKCVIENYMSRKKTLKEAQRLWDKAAGPGRVTVHHRVLQKAFHKYDERDAAADEISKIIALAVIGSISLGFGFIALAKAGVFSNSESEVFKMGIAPAALHRPVYERIEK